MAAGNGRQLEPMHTARAHAPTEGPQAGKPPATLLEMAGSTACVCSGPTFRRLYSLAKPRSGLTMLSGSLRRLQSERVHQSHQLHVGIALLVKLACIQYLIEVWWQAQRNSHSVLA